MADEVTIEVHGLSELSNKLDQLPSRMIKQIIGHALKAAGEVVLAELDERCPVKTKDAGPNSNSLPPGALLNSIHSKVRLFPQRNEGVCTIGPSEATAYVARFLEYGHARVSHGKRKDRRVLGNVPAKPFIRPAADASAQRAVEVFRQQLAQGIAEMDGIGNAAETPAA